MNLIPQHSLLDLVAAVGRRQVDNQLQLFGGVTHVLVLEAALLGRICPGKAFVEVHATVDGTDAD
jgi:hypothetical protein